MQNSGIKRVFLIVLDSFGCGAAPDAAEFGDAATCSTLRSVTESGLFPAANLTRLGLYNIDGIQTGTPDAAPIGAHARLRELSRGKDTTIGHWEMAGIVKNEPMPTYPDGFQQAILRHGGHPRLRTGARGDRCAHRLHLRRQRPPDRST